MVALLVAILGAYYLYRQIKADHERSRRQYATDLLLEWVRGLQKETHGVKKFVQGLTPEQCEHLQSGASFKVFDGQIEAALSILKHEFDIERDGGSSYLTLESDHVAFLRTAAVRYLNLLECILTAWASNVADQKIIAKQFQYLISDEAGDNALAVFRQKLGFDNFPSIASFAAFISAERQARREKFGKPKVI